MTSSDLLSLLQWWTMLTIIGVVFLPLTNLIFSNFFDRGYIFAKVLGTIFISYTVFLLGITKILPFTLPTIFSVIALFLLLNAFILIRVAPLSRLNLKMVWKIFLFEEFLFLATLFFWSYIRTHQPDIHGLEKYMDFGFINSILRSDYFPPKDMWFTPFSINYYYFGHLYTAVLTKLSGIPSSITYNLMLSTIFALMFTCSFSIGTNLISFMKQKARGDTTGRAPDPVKRGRQHFITLAGLPAEASAKAGGKVGAGPRAILAGFLTALLVTFAGNLHAIYSFFLPYQNENPVPFWQLIFSPQTFPNSYWYPNATRFIYNTIHEFPIYSFVVSDLHGHVLSIPIVLAIVALLYVVFIEKKTRPSILLLISFLLASAYMTNVWDGIIYAGLTFFVFSYLAYRSKNYTLYAIRYTLIVFGFFLFSLPFSLNFKPFVSAIGILCAPEFLTKIGSFGPFIFEADHCQRSPLWQLAILYGFFYFWVIIFFLNVILSRSKTKAKDLTGFFANAQNDIFIIILIVTSTLLILLPEFIYIKDIYPAHYRANTMFKLVYQSFIMLSIASGYIILRISNFKFTYWKLAVFGIGSIGLFLVMVFPYFAINSYYGDLKVYYGLDGIKYLQRLYPTDYEALLWLDKNIKGQPVILEAQGDSYTDFARVSANTGLPTVLGWTVHEWLWRGTYDVPAPRIEEVKALYEAKEVNITEQLIKKYKIKLVFIGDLERQKYPNLNETKFQNLGKIIYQNGQTKIYRLTD